MYPILALSVISCVVILERALFFSCNRYRLGETLRRYQNSQANTSNPKNNPIQKAIDSFKSGLEKGEIHCFNVGQRTAEQQIAKHERGLKLLATIGSIAPLVGLLGTVWGMVKAFSKIATLGDNVTPVDFADGIWTGLLTTVAGLLVAIPAVTASRLFEAKVDKLTRDFNELSSHLKEHYFTEPEDNKTNNKTA